MYMHTYMRTCVHRIETSFVYCTYCKFIMRNVNGLPPVVNNGIGSSTEDVL